MDYFECKNVLSNTKAYRDFIEYMHSTQESHIDSDVFYALAYKCIQEAFGVPNIDSFTSNYEVADYVSLRQNAIISKLREDGIELERVNSGLTSATL